jgi:hypothetical protein
VRDRQHRAVERSDLRQPLEFASLVVSGALRRNPMSLRNLMVLGLLASAGCYKNTYTTALQGGGHSHKREVAYFLWGLVGEHDFDVRAICPSGASWMQNRMNVVPDALVALLTIGIVSMRVVEIQCASGSAFLLHPDESRNVTWVEQIAEGASAEEATR